MWAVAGGQMNPAAKMAGRHQDIFPRGKTTQVRPSIAGVGTQTGPRVTQGHLAKRGKPVVREGHQFVNSLGGRRAVESDFFHRGSGQQPAVLTRHEIPWAFVDDALQQGGAGSARRRSVRGGVRPEVPSPGRGATRRTKDPRPHKSILLSIVPDLFAARHDPCLDRSSRESGFRRRTQHPGGSESRGALSRVATDALAPLFGQPIDAPQIFANGQGGFQRGQAIAVHRLHSAPFLL